MNRAKRIALEILGPPLLGASIPILWTTLAILWRSLATGKSPRFPPDLSTAAAFTFLFAFLLGGLPSILHMALMEWRFSRGLDPASWRAAIISTASGTLWGILIAASYGSFSRDYPILLPMGTAVGFLMGFLVKQLSQRISSTHR
jgi:hypothetical protein